VVKIWQLFGTPPGVGGSSHGTTGTVVNPALIISHLVKAIDLLSLYLCRPNGNRTGKLRVRYTRRSGPVNQ